jgi:hypothetical protein
MEKSIAVHIIGTLAQGIDPHTGVSFPPDSPYQHPGTVRALFEAVQALTAPGRSRSANQANPPNAGKPWSDEEDRTLAAAFDAGQPLPALAKAHCRTRRHPGPAGPAGENRGDGRDAALSQPAACRAGRLSSPSSIPGRRLRRPPAPETACPI